jgi:hypothetical protein
MMDQLLDTLEKMPFLETLDLEHSLPILPDESLTLLPTERVVHLPCLIMLNVYSMVLSYTHILNHISCPSMTCLKLICVPNWTDHDFSHLFPAITSVWTGKDGCPEPIAERDTRAGLGCKCKDASTRGRSRVCQTALA